MIEMTAASVSGSVGAMPKSSVFSTRLAAMATARSASLVERS